MLFESKFKIRTFHCDSFGHVNNARHLELLEESRWQFSEEIGLTPLLREQELGFIIMDMRIRFRAPVFEGNDVKVETSLIAIGSASGEVKQTVWVKGEKKPAIKSLFHFILIDRKQNNKSVAIEGSIRECLLDIIETD